MEEKFKNEFNQLIDKNENDLKQAREQVKYTSERNTVPIAILITCVVMAFGFFLAAEETHNIVAFIIGVIVSGIGFVAFKKIKYSSRDEYSEIYQNKIIEPLMQLYYNEPCSRMRAVGFPEETFRRIEYKNFNIYHSSNFVSGIIKQGHELKMANVTAIDRKYNPYHTANESLDCDKIVFKGLIVEIKLSQSLNHYLYIKNKKNPLTKELNEIVKGWKLNEYKINKEELSELEIYTSNQEFADEILYKGITSTIIEYSHLLRTGELCEMAIKENHIYLMIPRNKVPGTDIILYENREDMYQKLWEQYSNFSLIFEFCYHIIDNLMTKE